MVLPGDMQGLNPKRLTKPVRVSFMVRAGDEVRLRQDRVITKPVKVSFYIRPKGSKKRKRVSFIARR